MYGPNRKTSTVSISSNGPQGVGPNGAYASVGLNNPQFAAMASSQNLPAVLNDPRKGKQKDFFTRSWGEDFTESKAIPSSPFVCQVPDYAFDKYLKKLRRHCPRHSQRVNSNQGQRASASPARTVPSSVSSSSLTNISNVPAIFLDPDFDMNNQETFEKIFPFLSSTSKRSMGTEEAAVLCQQIESSGRLAQEKLSHHLDVVEISIAEQVAQKSHHFFQIMTYHDALINQLSGLVQKVEKLRSCLQETDKNVYTVALDVCRLRRRHKNAVLIMDKLTLMSSLHQTQPTIQILLSGNEFSGALDLISTSRDILRADLQGVTSFRYLSSQLQEIQSIIGKMLLGDFQSYIASEIHRDIKHVKASILVETPFPELGEAETEQITSVIFGLLRQNSFTFLEVLENASIHAVKNTFRDVTVDLLTRSKEDMAITSVAAEFARTASSQEWVHFFDVLLGSLIFLLRRIHCIQLVIAEAVSKTVVSNSSLAIPDHQLNALKVSSQDVMINVCDQVVERSSKILAQRSKSVAAKLITTKELKDLGKLIDILAAETLAMTGKMSAGLQLSLQSQSLMYIQAFDNEKRQCLTALLEQEKWKKSDMDIARTLVKFEQLPHFLEIFGSSDPPNSTDPTPTETEASSSNGATSGSDSDTTKSDLINNNNGHISPETKLTPGDIRIAGRTYSVTDSAHLFLSILAEYCDLCTTLPSVSIELGLKSAEIIKFYNSRICQLILGVAAISVSGLKTITIRNLALAKQSLQIVIDFIPHVRSHFETVYHEKKQLATATSTPTTASLKSIESSPTAATMATVAETKQLEALQRQFDQALKHLSNHVEELEQKILSVVESILQHQLSTWTASSASLPSANFRALCKQLAKLYESVADIWPHDSTITLMKEVHQRFVASVKYEIRQRKILDPESPQARLLLSELTFYGQSLLRLNVVPEEWLQRDTFEKIWLDV